VLEQLASSPFKPELVITQPDKEKGRGRKLSISEVKALANELHIDIFQPKRLSGLDVRQTIEDLKTDALVVAAYGQIIPQEILDIPLFGGINVHASILPRWRGAAPIERAIMAGDTQSGISIMQMDKGLDTGPVYQTATLPNIDQMSVLEIEKEMAKLGSDEVIKTLEAFQMHKKGGRSKPVPIAQDNAFATYAHKIAPADRVPNWEGSAHSLNLQIKALAHRQPVFIEVEDLVIQLLQSEVLDTTKTPTIPGKIVGIGNNGICVECGIGSLQIKQVKLNRGQGKPMDIKAFLNGYENALSVDKILASNNAK